MKKHKLKPLPNGERNPKNETALPEINGQIKGESKFGLSAEFCLGTCLTLFCVALTQLGESIKYLSVKGVEYIAFMIFFIITLSLACLFLGLYLGKKGHKHLNNQDSSR